MGMPLVINTICIVIILMAIYCLVGRKESRGRRINMASMLVSLIYCFLVTVGELLCMDYVPQLLIIDRMVSDFVFGILFIFYYHYIIYVTGFRIDRKITIGFMSAYAFFLLLLLTDSSHHWFYRKLDVRTGGNGYFKFQIQHGIGFYLFYAVLLLTSFFCFYLAWKYMDKEYFFGSLASMTFLSLAIDALHFLTAYTPDVPEKMLSCITGGVMYGIVMGIVYRVGGGTGGMDIVGGIINKYYSISQGTTNFIFNIFIMFCGTIAFGIEAVLYTMLTFFIVFKVTNSFASGFDYKKNIIIISEHYEEIASGIIKIVGRGVTYLYGEGAYTHQQRKVLFVVAKLTQVARIRQIVRKKDPGAFMIITEASDVFGRGFTSAPSGKHKQKKIFALINHYEEEGK